MRFVLAFAVTVLIAVLFAGCSSNLMTPPSVAVPVLLTKQAINGNDADRAFVKDEIDLTHDEAWRQSGGVVNAVSVNMLAENTTTDSANPGSARLHFFVSASDDLTVSTVGNAIPLLDTYLPGGTTSIRYDSGTVPLSAAARDIVDTGKFTLYVTGSPDAIALQIIHGQLELTCQADTR